METPEITCTCLPYDKVITKSCYCCRKKYDEPIGKEYAQFECELHMDESLFSDKKHRTCSECKDKCTCRPFDSPMKRTCILCHKNYDGILGSIAAMVDCQVHNFEIASTTILLGAEISTLDSFISLIVAPLSVTPE